MGNKIKAALREDSDQPVAISSFFFENFSRMEILVLKPIEAFVYNDPVGEWLMGIKGIGPVLAGGLLSILDVTKAKAGPSFWRFAGLDPTLVWEKGQKRPFHGRLKTLCYLIAQSFVMTSKQEDSFYGRLYVEEKEKLTKRNEALEFKDKAAEILERIEKARGSTQRFTEEPNEEMEGEEVQHDETEETKKEALDMLRNGMLFKRIIDQRARRFAVKIFLSHLFTVMFESHYRYRAPEPYVIEHMGHVDYIPPPNWDQYKKMPGQRYPMLKNDGHPES
jgi:hypothetical protein